MTSLFEAIQNKVNKGKELIDTEVQKEVEKHALSLNNWKKLKHELIVKIGMAEYEPFFLAYYEIDKFAYTKDPAYGHGISRLILALPNMLPIGLSVGSRFNNDVSLNTLNNNSVYISNIIVLTSGSSTDKLLGYEFYAHINYNKQEDFDASFNKALYYAKSKYNCHERLDALKKIHSGEFYARGNCGGDCDPRI